VADESGVCRDTVEQARLAHSICRHAARAVCLVGAAAPLRGHAVAAVFCAQSCQDNRIPCPDFALLLRVGLRAQRAAGRP